MESAISTVTVMATLKAQEQRAVKALVESATVIAVGMLNLKGQELKMVTGLVASATSIKHFRTFYRSLFEAEPRLAA